MKARLGIQDGIVDGRADETSLILGSELYPLGRCIENGSPWCDGRGDIESRLASFTNHCVSSNRGADGRTWDQRTSPD